MERVILNSLVMFVRRIVMLDGWLFPRGCSGQQDVRFADFGGVSAKTVAVTFGGFLARGE
jgi:hypothetical protein